MPSAISHAVAGLGIAACFCGPETPKSLWALGALCAALPDVDVLGFRFGIRYGSLWGHRGFTHSIVFAAALAGLIVGITAMMTVGLGFRHGVPGLPPWRLWLFLFLATISHGLLDMLTDGGLGVALLAPFDNRRFFFPFQPIEVASFGVAWLFTRRGAIVLASELRWVCLPSATLAAIAVLVRRVSGSS
jgi:inner membrane protein